MEDVIIFLTWLGIYGYWFYLHFNFYQLLKTKDPALYDLNSGWSPFKYSTSFACFDLALKGAHKQSNDTDVIKAGDKLVKAYEIKFKLFGFGLLFSFIIYAIAGVFWIIR